MDEGGRRYGGEKRGERGSAQRRNRNEPRRAAADTTRLADELEEHARALLALARELRQGGGGQRTGREARPGAPQRGERSRRDEREGRGRARPATGDRSQRDRGEAPDWVPASRRRKT